MLLHTPLRISPASADRHGAVCGNVARNSLAIVLRFSNSGKQTLAFFFDKR
jgi:hypothetical protein